MWSSLQDFNLLSPRSPPMMTSSNGNIFRITDPLSGEFTGPGEFPAQRPVTQSFDVFFDLRPNKRLTKPQARATPSWWTHNKCCPHSLLPGIEYWYCQWGAKSEHHHQLGGTNSCGVNNREAGDLRRYRGHYDVNVMHQICDDRLKSRYKALLQVQ